MEDKCSEMWGGPVMLPSPRSNLAQLGLFSASKPFPLMAEEDKRRSEGVGRDGNMVSAVGMEEEEKEEVGFGDWKIPMSRNGGSIAERRAARCGFNYTPRVNTARFRCVSPMSSPAIRSPYLTIPPGLSPTTLLDSPVMLMNSQAQSSPTTGSFLLPPHNYEILAPNPAVANRDKEKFEDVDSPFIFKPQMDLICMPSLQSAENQVASSILAEHLRITDINHQNQAIVQTQMEFKGQACFAENNIEGSDNATEKANCVDVQTNHTRLANNQTCQLEEPLNGRDTGSQQLLEGDQMVAFPPMGMGRPSEDGYNWRKYGQKQVKGSEYPRSYYKCTHPSCQVKKKVERSHDGQITEIIYKGAHNHPKPQPTRRSAFGSSYSMAEMSETVEGPVSYANIEGGSMWSSQQGPKDKNGADWRADGLERSSSTSIVTELSDPLSNAHGRNTNVFDIMDNPDLLSTLASHGDDEDGATQGSMSLGDGEDDENESKRRKKECCLIETSSGSRAVREPRVVVQTDSEVDILEDGYRWRKYGQKVVKGNPNPRSYYKCTNPGCSVRKHVERASHDLKSVITTYEGKHNHEVPVARNSNHISSGGNFPPPSNAQTSMTLHGSTNIAKPEPQGQDLIPRFEKKLELGSEYLKPAYLGSLTGDLKLGASPSYEMKLHQLQPPMSLGSFGLNNGYTEVHKAISIANIIPDFPISFPSGVHRPSNLSFSYDLNHGRPIGQQPKESEMRFFRLPKQEQDNGVYDSHLTINNLSNASPSVYGQVMGGFQLQ